MSGLPPGWRIGHATDQARATGCTVVLPPPDTIASVDVRGGAPGTRETGGLTPGNLVSVVDAVLLTGGSSFGLAAAQGVEGWLKERGLGFSIGGVRVPIVPAAVLFDLAVGDASAYPDAAMGRAACEAARDGAVETGRVGAGTGAMVAKALGIARARPGGLGFAARELPGGSVVAAVAAVNAFGDVVDPDTGEPVAAPKPQGGKLIRSSEALISGPVADGPAAGGNTTLVCLVSTVPFEPASLRRVAIEAQAGVARAVRPAHTVVDGDVVFALAPQANAAPSLPIRLRVGAAAAEVTAAAILDAVRPR